MFDTLSNLFSHIQNGQKSGILIIKHRHSHTIIAILNVLYEHGYIRGYRFCSNRPVGKTPFIKNQIEILLKYQNRKAAINKLVRISKPSRRIYLSVDQLVRIQIANMPMSQLIQGTAGNRRNGPKGFGPHGAPREDTFLFMQGILILSTSQGIMSNITAQKLHVGGEVLGHVCS